MQKPGHMVLKRVNWVHNNKIRLNGHGNESIRVHNDKIRSNGLERSQLGTQ